MRRRGVKKVNTQRSKDAFEVKKFTRGTIFNDPLMNSSNKMEGIFQPHIIIPKMPDSVLLQDSVENTPINFKEKECEDSEKLLKAYRARYNVAVNELKEEYKKREKTLVKIIGKNKKRIIEKINVFNKIHSKQEADNFVIKNVTEFSPLLTHAADVFEIIFLFVDTKNLLLNVCMSCSFFYTIIVKKCTLSVSLANSHFENLPISSLLSSFSLHSLSMNDVRINQNSESLHQTASKVNALLETSRNTLRKVLFLVNCTATRNLYLRGVKASPEKYNFQCNQLRENVLALKRLNVLNMGGTKALYSGKFFEKLIDLNISELTFDVCQFFIEKTNRTQQQGLNFGGGNPFGGGGATFGFNFGFGGGLPANNNNVNQDTDKKEKEKKKEEKVVSPLDALKIYLQSCPKIVKIRMTCRSDLNNVFKQGPNLQEKKDKVVNFILEISDELMALSTLRELRFLLPKKDLPMEFYPFLSNLSMTEVLVVSFQGLLAPGQNNVQPPTNLQITKLVEDWKDRKEQNLVKSHLKFEFFGFIHSADVEQVFDLDDTELTIIPVTRMKPIDMRKCKVRKVILKAPNLDFHYDHSQTVSLLQKVLIQSTTQYVELEGLTINPSSGGFGFGAFGSSNNYNVLESVVMAILNSRVIRKVKIGFSFTGKVKSKRVIENLCVKLLTNLLRANKKNLESVIFKTGYPFVEKNQTPFQQLHPPQEQENASVLGFTEDSLDEEKDPSIKEDFFTAIRENKYIKEVFVFSKWEHEIREVIRYK